MVEDKDEISRLRGETKRLTAELAAERAAHSSVQIESGELNSIRLKYNELMLELAQLKGEHSNLGVYRAQECFQIKSAFTNWLLINQFKKEHLFEIFKRQKKYLPLDKL